MNKFAQHHNSILNYQAEHFGSTSIPTISAKPALDIMLVFKSEQEVKASVPFFEKLGFVYKGDVVGMINQVSPDPMRHFFSLYDLDRTTDFIHLHVYVEGHPDIANNLRFRDILRNNPDIAKEYERLKGKLKGGEFSRPDRIRNKSNFISKLLLIE